MTRTLRAVATCMRNEGLILLEWVAHHRSIGFDRVFVASNNCNDLTEAMLDRLEAMGEVIHIRNQPGPGEAPQVSGMRGILAHPAMADVEWLLHIDADEFLNVSTGAGKVDDMLSAVGPCDAIALAWRMFGSAGETEWRSGSILARHTRTQDRHLRRMHFHKSMFRPDRFARASDHMPKEPRAEDVVLRNSAGVKMPTDMLFHPDGSRHRSAPFRMMTWENACVNHYAIRSRDVFLMKNMRGDGMGMEARQKYHVNSTFWRNAEQNAVEDHGILRHRAEVAARLERYRADPVLSALESGAQAWFQVMRDRLLTAERIAALTLAAAAEEDGDDD
ncbi:MAG: glycosyltransferase family 2 protein [Paracoccaceae bacterium]